MADELTKKVADAARAVRSLTARIFPDSSRIMKAAASDSTTPASKAISTDDLFASVSGRIVDPPYDPAVLVELATQSSELGQAVEAMETNIAGFGWRIVPTHVLPKDAPADVVKRASWEKTFVKNFFDYCSIGQRLSFTALRRRVRKDAEIVGYAFVEIVCNLNGRIVEFRPLPAHTVRLGKESTDLVEFNEPVLTQGEDGSVVYEIRLILRRARLFAQGGGSTSKVRWFKEVGDARVIDNETGEVVPPEQVASFGNTNEPMPESRKAGELLYFSLYFPGTPYGVPRWIGNTTAVLGVRQAEETSYHTMKNNMIPSAFITVSDGRLTPTSIDRISQFVDESIKGESNYSRFVLLEAEAEFEGDTPGAPKIDVKPMTDMQRTEGLFPNYIELSKDSIRRSFRLPGIFVGSVKDVNKSNLDGSRALADEQVFAPERTEEDWTWNVVVLARLGILHYRIASRTPNVTDNQELISMLSVVERTGGLTPRIARSVVEDVFPSAAEAPPLDSEKFDPDVPFSLTLAERMKNLADPTEPNQTTAPVMGARGDAVTQRADPEPKADEGDLFGVHLRRLIDVSGRANAELKRAIGVPSHDPD